MKAGSVVMGPFPALEGDHNIGNHFLVVLAEDKLNGSVMVVFTTSLKEGVQGGEYAFRPEERAAVNWSRPCRFDPTRVAAFSKEDIAELRSLQVRLPASAVERIAKAVVRAKPVVRKFKPEAVCA